MRIAIVGAGPAGLVAAALIKARRPDAELVVIEQNAADATFGFGVVLSEQALSFLADDDPATAAIVEPHLERWRDITIVHKGTRISIDGVGFSAIGRLDLLRLLQRRLADLGVMPEFGRQLSRIADLDGFDLVIAADGANSFVRSALAPAFGTTVRLLDNRFAWFGTAQRFETLTQTFVAAPAGNFNAHHYRYAPGRSTFIVETDSATFACAGLAQMSPEQSRAVCEAAFSEALGGHPLIANHSIWRQFPCVRNACWSHGRFVLVGDALHTAHFSIGSGTRLALDDVIALIAALVAKDWRVEDGLAAYEAARRPVADKLVAAADASAHWYEQFATHMALASWPFAMSYIRRSGRVDDARLAALSPKFMAGYRAAVSPP